MSRQDQQPQALDRKQIATEETGVVARALSERLDPKIVQKISGKTPEMLARKLPVKQFDTVLAAVSTVADEAVDDFATTRAKRDEIALSLALYAYGDPEAEGLSSRLGISRQRMYEMRCDALRLSDEERTAGPSCTPKRWARRNCGCEGHWLNNATPEQVAARARENGVSEVPVAWGVRELPELAERALRAEERKKIAIVLRDQLVQSFVWAAGEDWSRNHLAEVISKNPSQITRILAKPPKVASVLVGAA